MVNGTWNKPVIRTTLEQALHDLNIRVQSGTFDPQGEYKRPDYDPRTRTNKRRIRRGKK
ncbi:MAG: hypothetical protein AB7F22_07920 [Reyranella sp.]|uniref:hypothetical protein n=1 Tax=Reyranella sp. TaxID=1929291 RepID=UPI003D0B994E